MVECRGGRPPGLHGGRNRPGEQDRVLLPESVPGGAAGQEGAADTAASQLQVGL